jgi:hypothetical protein
MESTANALPHDISRPPWPSWAHRESEDLTWQDRSNETIRPSSGVDSWTLSSAESKLPVSRPRRVDPGFLIPLQKVLVALVYSAAPWLRLLPGSRSIRWSAV